MFALGARKIFQQMTALHWVFRSKVLEGGAARDTNPTGTFTRKMTILLFFFFAREIRKVFSRVLLRIIKRSKMLHTISFRRYRMTDGLEMQSASLD